ncbi:MAG: AsmA-like C-terminal region-containing protein [Hyphomicrobiales bacterium]
MRFKTAIAGVIGGCVIAAALAVLLLKINHVAGAAADGLLRDTGLRLTYSGLPGLSLWPSSAITLNNAVIASPNGGPPLLSAAELRLTLDRTILAGGDHRILSAALVDPRFNLIVDRNGKASWTVGHVNESAQSNLPVHIVNGRFAFLDERSGFAFAIDEIEALTDLASNGELTAKGGLVWRKQPVDFSLFLKSPQRLAQDGSPIDLNLTAPSMTFALSGRASATPGFDLSGRATLKADDLRQLVSWLGNKVSGSKGLGKFEISGAFDATPKALSFRDARLSLDGMNGQGNAVFSRPGGRPRVEASLGVDRLDLNVYRAHPSRAEPLTLLEDGWSTETLTFSALRDFDAAISFAANQIAFGELRSGHARADARLSSGILDLTVSETSAYGGKASAKLKLDAAKSAPGIAMSFSGTDLDAGPALKGAMAFGKLTGKLSTTFSVTSAGSSIAELVSRLAGSGSFRVTDGSVPDLDVADIAKRANDEVEDGWPLDPTLATSFDALSASFTIEDGIAATQNLTLAAPSLSLPLRGEIDLARQALNLSGEPSLDGKPALPVPLVVKGPWIGPRIYPDIPGILEDAATAFRALKKLAGSGAAKAEGVSVPAN